MVGLVTGAQGKGRTVCLRRRSHFNFNRDRTGIVLVNRRSMICKEPTVTVPLGAVGTASAVGSQRSKRVVVRDRHFSNLLTSTPSSVAKVGGLVLSTIEGRGCRGKLRTALGDVIPVTQKVKSSTYITITLTQTLFDFFSLRFDRGRLLTTTGVRRITARVGPDKLSTTAYTSGAPV